MKTADVVDYAMETEEEISKLEYPSVPTKPRKSKDESNQAYGKRLDEYEVIRDGYDAAMKLYRQRVVEITAKFKADALKVTGFDTHPKVDKIWNFAWEHGHASGLYEVAMWLAELKELLSEGG